MPLNPKDFSPAEGGGVLMDSALGKFFIKACSERIKVLLLNKLDKYSKRYYGSTYGNRRYISNTNKD
jgi:hypothetical protein